MTQQHHPIVPPPEAMERLCTQAGKTWQDRIELAYQAGADAELEACVQRQALLYGNRAADDLRAARRPRPLNLKEQALKDVDEILKNPSGPVGSDFDRIISALKSIPDPS